MAPKKKVAVTKEEEVERKEEPTPEGKNVRFLFKLNAKLAVSTPPPIEVPAAPPPPSSPDPKDRKARKTEVPPNPYAIPEGVPCNILTVILELPNGHQVKGSHVWTSSPLPDDAPADDTSAPSDPPPTSESPDEATTDEAVPHQPVTEVTVFNHAQFSEPCFVDEAFVRKFGEAQCRLKVVACWSDGRLAPPPSAAAAEEGGKGKDKKKEKEKKEKDAAQPPDGQPPPGSLFPPGVHELEWTRRPVVFHVDAREMLLGATCTHDALPHKREALDPTVASLFSHLALTIDLKEPRVPLPVLPAPEELKTSAKTSSQGSRPGTKEKAKPVATPKEEPPPLSAAEVPGEPPGSQPFHSETNAQLLTEKLVRELNPLMIHVKKAKALPDQPATVHQLDHQCDPVTLKVRFLQDTPSLVREQQGTQRGEWEERGVLNVRTVDFHQPMVFFMPDVCRSLAELLPQTQPQPTHVTTNRFSSSNVELPFNIDLGGEISTAPTPPTPPAAPSLSPHDLMRLGWETLLDSLKSKKLIIEVHDRICNVEEVNLFADPDAPPPNQREPSMGGRAEDVAGTVFGSCLISLADLLKGRTSFVREGHLSPTTTVRGAAGLDWRRRPGRYMEAESFIKVEVRQAIPLMQTQVPSDANAPFVRAVFVMDYRDTELLHKVERAVRMCNAIVLGLGAEGGGRFGVRVQDVEDKEVDVRVLQRLNTWKLTPEQAADKTLDIITGFQLIDGDVRMFFLEGLLKGCMQIVQHQAEFAQANKPAELGPSSDRMRPRVVMWNPSLKHSARLYGPLGVYLQQVKLRAPLPRIVSEPGTFATGKVRKECMEGVKRLARLSLVTWARQLEELALIPTEYQVSLVFKKFGGELTKADVEGWSPEVNEEQIEVGSDGIAYVIDEHGNRKRREPLKPAVKPENPEYLDELEERAEARAEMDWEEANRQYIADLAGSRGRERRELWSTWNPQSVYRTMDRETLLSLTKQMDAEERVRLRDDPSHSHLTQEEMRARGMFPHPKPFRWPEKRTPAELNALPKPSEWRVEELQRPWEEPGAGTQTGPRDLKPPHGMPNFHTITHSNVFFEADLIHYRSVHLVPDDDFLQQREKELQDWRAKAVGSVDFRSIVPSAKTANQVDKFKGLLKGEPRTVSLRKTHVAPPPVSFALQHRWKPNAGVLKRDEDPDKHIGGNFQRFIAEESTMLNKKWTKRLGD